MSKTHQEQHDLAQQIEAARQKVTVGAKYRHYKGADKTYAVMGLGFIEEDEELCVIYRAEYGEKLTFIRPLTVWIEQVEWGGKTVPRFAKL